MMDEKSFFYSLYNSNLVKIKHQCFSMESSPSLLQINGRNFQNFTNSVDLPNQTRVSNQAVDMSTPLTEV